MNNDLEQFSEERLKEIVSAIKLEPCDYHDVYDNIQHGEIAALARIALAAKQAKPVNSPCEKCKGSGFMDSGGTQPWGEPIIVQCDCTTPQPSHTEQDGWISITKHMLADYRDVKNAEVEKYKAGYAGYYDRPGTRWARDFADLSDDLHAIDALLATAPKPESELINPDEQCKEKKKDQW